MHRVNIDMRKKCLFFFNQVNNCRLERDIIINLFLAQDIIFLHDFDIYLIKFDLKKKSQKSCFLLKVNQIHSIDIKI